MNLEQIRNAVIDTAYIGVIEAYLRSKQFQSAFTKKYGFNGVGATRLRTILAEETDMYAAVQKNDHGCVFISQFRILCPLSNSLRAASTSSILASSA